MPGAKISPSPSYFLNMPLIQLRLLILSYIMSQKLILKKSTYYNIIYCMVFEITIWDIEIHIFLCHIISAVLDFCILIQDVDRQNFLSHFDMLTNIVLINLHVTAVLNLEKTITYIYIIFILYIYLQICNGHNSVNFRLKLYIDHTLKH